MKVAWCPQAGDMGVNPYWRLLRHALEQREVAFDDSPSWSFSYRWLRAKKGDVNVIHFHSVRRFWEYQWTKARLDWVGRFIRNLLIARILGYRTVLTVHDLRPLEHAIYPDWVDYFGHRAAANLTDAVIVHYESGRRLFAQEYGRQHGVHVGRHPNYIGVYPNSVPRPEARRHFGFSDQLRVLTFFGGIRPNKGIDNLVAAFRELPGDDLRLVIAGQPWEPAAYVHALFELARHDRRISIVAEPIPDEQVQYFMNASNAVVLPFRQIHTSGSAMLAMSFARPVIASAAGSLPDMVQTDCGVLYQPEVPGALTGAMKRALESDLDAMGRHAYNRALASTWEDLAQVTLQAYVGSAGGTCKFWPP